MYIYVTLRIHDTPHILWPTPAFPSSSNIISLPTTGKHKETLANYTYIHTYRMQTGDCRARAGPTETENISISRSGN